MARYAGMRLIDVWYASITDNDIHEAARAGLLAGRKGASRRKVLEAILSKARAKDGLKASESLTGVVTGRRVILDDPPTVEHVPVDLGQGAIQKFFTDYRASLSDNRRKFLERYRFVDAALKVVGVGSVGTRCWIVVLEGRDENDPLILQLKEATTSASTTSRQWACQPRRASRGGPAADAGDPGHPARLDARPGWS